MYLHEDLHAASQPQNQVQSGLLLDVVVRKSAAILKLFASKDQALLSGGMQKKKRFPGFSGRASGDEKTPEIGNGLRNCIFKALLFVPPDTNA